MLLVVFFTAVLGPWGSTADPRYLWGNALTDKLSTVGPDGASYPSDLIDEMYQAGDFGGSSRHGNRGRALFESTLDPNTVTDLLLRSQEPEDRSSQRRGRSMYPRSTNSAKATARNLVNNDVNANLKLATGRSEGISNFTIEGRESAFPEGSLSGCPSAPPAQLCPTKYNTTAPMWGTSLTSGKRVTIVQKFPDLLQQVIFHECAAEQCDFIHGRCTQTYTPYLFLVIPLGPVTLTGQDYVMVESGCACQPKYSSGTPYDTPLDAFIG